MQEHPTDKSVFEKRIKDVFEYAIFAPEENLLLCAIARRVEKIASALRLCGYS